MKKFSILLLNVLLAGVVMLSSCGKDDEEEPAAPTIDFVSGEGYSTGDETVNPGDYVSFKVLITKKDNNVESLTIKEDGNTLTTERIYVGDERPAANPISVANGGETLEIDIEARLTAGTNTIEFEVKDNKGLVSKKSIRITVEAEGTPFGAATEATIWNRIGPWSASYNIVTGENVSSGPVEAEVNNDISDARTQVSEGLFNGSWEAKNATRFVKVNDFDFTSGTKEAAATAYAAGTATAVVNAPAVNDIYIAKLRGGNDYALIKVKTIDATAKQDPAIVTTNTGKIVFDIKK